MHKQLENSGKESGRMMALAVASTNLLILTIMISGIWFVYSLMDKTDRLNELARGFQLMP